MKLLKSSLLFFLFSACDIYTIQNNYPDNIVAGSVVMTPLQCVEFFDFPIIGDFPVQFRYKNRQLISNKEYPAGHYLISETAEIQKQEEPCEIETVGQPPVSLNEEKGSSSAGETLSPDNLSVEESPAPEPSEEPPPLESGE